MHRKQRDLKFYKEYFSLYSKWKKKKKLNSKEFTDFFSKYNESPWNRGDLESVYGTPQKAVDEECLSNLKDRACVLDFIRLKLSKGLKHYEIAKLLGVSRMTIWKLVKVIREASGE